MKELTLKNSRGSRFLHASLILIVVAGFICTAASFSQAISTSNGVVSRVVNYDEARDLARIGLVSLGITGLALIMTAFSTLARNRKIIRLGSEFMNASTDLSTKIKACRKDINKLKEKKPKSKKS